MRSVETLRKLRGRAAEADSSGSKPSLRLFSCCYGVVNAPAHVPSAKPPKAAEGSRSANPHAEETVACTEAGWKTSWTGFFPRCNRLDPHSFGVCFALPTVSHPQPGGIAAHAVGLLTLRAQHPLHEMQSQCLSARLEQAAEAAAAFPLCGRSCNCKLRTRRISFGHAGDDQLWEGRVLPQLQRLCIQS